MTNLSPRISVSRAALVAATVSLAAAATACSQGAPPADDAPRGAAQQAQSLLPPGCNTTDAWYQTLVGKGYTVQPGVVYFENACSESAPSCGFNNPVTPYGHYQLPASPDDPSQPPPSSIWQLESDEAVVFCGYTPPPAEYYSWRSYVSTWYDSDDGQTLQLAASLGDSLNNEVVQTAGSGPQGNAVTLVTTTANKTVTAVVQNAFAGAGIPRSAMNTDTIPESEVTMGFGPTADTFDMLIRIAFPADSGAEAQYEGPQGPTGGTPYAAVYRITPGSALRDNPYAISLRSTSPTVNERTAAIVGDLDAVGAAIQATYGQTGTSSGAVPDSTYGFACIADETPCYGDNRDAVYTTSTGTLFFGGATGSGDGPSDQDFYVVYGVYHPALGNAVYTTVDVNEVSQKLGVGPSTQVLEGSAGAYFPDGGAPAEIYAFEFARNCGSAPNCYAVPASPWPALPYGAQLNFIERAYLNPATQTGPAISDLEAPRVLYFPHR